MKTILKLDHDYYLLPATANVNALLAVLTKIEKLKWDYERATSREKYLLEGSPKIAIELVGDDQVQTKPKRKALPEKASPDCHGQDITKQA